MPIRLVWARSMLGWSQNELARTSKVAAAQISRYESGVSKPRPQAIAKIAEALGVSFEWLAHGTGDMPSGREAPTPQGWTSMAVELEPELHEAVLAKARARGITPEALMIQIIQQEVLNAAEAGTLEISPERVQEIEERLNRLESAIQLHQGSQGTAVQRLQPTSELSKKSPKK
ncbi:helix-turn-helix domain-containing protein [Comamonas serinivorans]|nr:helix-turn-helix transcriptional regulator [Comamonas serinivorans]